MKKNAKIFFLLFMLCIAYTLPSISQSILEDTIWYRPQSYNIGSVQFLKNDQFIIVNGQKLYDTKTGNILNQISGSDEMIHPFSNDDFFVKQQLEKQKLYIYKTEGLQLIDSLEGIMDIGSYQKVDISIDSKFLVGYLNQGENLSIWDLNSKKILRKQNEKDTILKGAGKVEIAFSADNSKIFVHLIKDYYKGEDPKHNPIYVGTSNIVIFDAQTLDSIGSIDGITAFGMSKDRKLMAISGHGKDDYIAILDLETMKVRQYINIKLIPTSDFKFSDDNKYLVTTGEQGKYSLNFWDLDNGKKIYFYNTGIDGFDLSKDNSKLISYGGKELLLLKTHLNVNGITNPVSGQTIIYPNPVNQKATIEFASRIRNVEYSIINQSGSIVKKSLFMANTEAINKMEMDFSIYPSGIYFVNLFTGDSIPQTIKLIKE